jgi:hypothetical protein
MTKWIALGAACWIVGCASTGNAPSRSNSPPVAATPVAATPAGCVNQTGSLIPQKPGTCTAFGHSYSDTDMRNTGRTTVAGALQQLDPTINVLH